MTSTLERSSRNDVDPRFAARREAVDAERRRKRLRRWGIVVVLVALVSGAWYLTRTPLLDVDRIAVEGTVQTPVDEVLVASGIRIGEPLLEVDGSASAERIRALPWVDTAKVARDRNGQVTITVTEREMVAVATDEAGGAWLVDGTGRVLAADGTMDMIDTVLVGAVAGPPGSTVEVAESSLAVAALLTPGMRSRIATITTNPDGTVTLGLRPQGTVVLGPPTDLPAKIAALRTVMAQVDQRDLASINVVNPSTPVVVRTPKQP